MSAFLESRRIGMWEILRFLFFFFFVQNSAIGQLPVYYYGDADIVQDRFARCEEVCDYQNPETPTLFFIQIYEPHKLPVKSVSYNRSSQNLILLSHNLIVVFIQVTNLIPRLVKLWIWGFSIR